LEERGALATHHLHHQTNLFGNKLVLGVGVDIVGVTRVVVLGDGGLHGLVDEAEGGRGEFVVVLGEGVEGLEEGVVLVDGVVLQKLLVLLDDLAHKGLHRLQEVLARHRHVLQVLPQDVPNGTLEGLAETAIDAI
jgi:hypothetical protein